MKIFLFIISALVCSSLQAATYYFSSSSGNDNHSSQEAQNSNTPWKSIEKLNNSFANFQPGDILSFKRGDIFYGTIVINKSGTGSAPITFSAYGNGSKPVITGLSTLNNWNATGTNTFEAVSTLGVHSINLLLINNIAKAISRYPNSDAANGGYLYYQSSVANTSIADDHLSGKNFNGGEVIIRKNRWVIDRNKINQHSGNTITYTSQSGYWPDPGYGYFIQNHPATLDREGEWYYNSTSKRVGIFTTGGINALQNVQVATIDVLIQLQNHSNIVFENIIFKGSNQHTFNLKNARHIRVNNCELLFNGGNAITADNTTNVTVENSIINFTNNNAFNGISSNQTNLKNNIIKNTGVFAGMGDGDSGSYEALLLSGSDNTIESNRIDSTGYIPITFNGSNISITSNFISNYAFVKDDGGAIYTWNNSSNPPVHTNRLIKKNIVLNGIGASDGTSDPSGKKYAHGIYIDDNATNIIIDGNSVSNCNGFGLYVHNARDLSITNNTLYNSKVQLVMEHDDIAPNSPVANNNVTGNILFSLLADQPVAEYKSRRDDLGNFGTFNKNYYCRPIDDNAVINTLKKVNGTYQFQAVDLDGWKLMHGKDQNSSITPKQFASFSINQVLSLNKYANGNFTNDVGGLYAYSNANNCITSWNSGPLDGGTLRVSFTSQAGNNNKGTLIIGVGSVSANKSYILSFSLKGTASQKMMEVYLRKSLSPYNDITGRKLIKIIDNRKEVSIAFTPTESQSNASIGIDIPELSNPVYFDNIQLIEASITPANVQDSVRFVYNANLATNSFLLGKNYIDVATNHYNESITLTGFSSSVLLQTSSAIINTPLQCSATGTILHERWDNVGGNDIGNNNWTNASTSSIQLQFFEGPSNAADNYASRIRGYICPPATGNYIFYIAGDDATELFLSTDSNPSNKQQIAYSLSWTGEREWNKYPTQKSAPVLLEAEKKYYIEALHKEGGGGDHISVAWQLPTGELEAPIPGSRLSPFQSGTSLADNQTILFSPVADVHIGAAPFALDATATSGLPVTYRIVSGNATLAGNLCSVNATGNVVIEASQPGNASYNAAPLVTRSFSVIEKTICSATGYILRQQWDNIGGNNITDNNWNNKAGSSHHLTLFEGPTNVAENYASRISGYICPPSTGSYTFYIAGDDATELFLSPDAKPSNKVKIAYSLSWTGEREWNRYASQKSAQILLEGGKKYYIEALHKEGNGGDHLAVAWKLPNNIFEGPIDGVHLSPYIPLEVAAEQTITFPPINTISAGTPPFPLNAVASSGLPVIFKIISGPAIVSNNIITIIDAGTIVVQASQPGNTSYNAAPEVNRTLVVLPGNTCSATGNILREYWGNVNGNNLWDNNWNNQPGATNLLNLFETPENMADNYASRVRGYICPPQNGYYTFWIAGDDATELYLSTNESIGSTVKIAFNLSWTGAREWNRFSTQKSALIYLEAGKQYYIEALHKEGAGGDHLAVGWQLPDGIREMPIPGNRLSPYMNANQQNGNSHMAANSILFHTDTSKQKSNLLINPNPVVNNSTIAFTLLNNGNATLSILDIQGRIKRLLYKGEVKAGLPTIIKFNPLELGSGIYTLQLITGKEILSRKIVIMK